MAINKVDAPGITPATFWPQVINQLLALTIDKEPFDRCVNAFVKQGSLFNIGGVMFIADSDTAIGGTQSTAVAVKFVVSGSTASATYVDSMTGVTWNGGYSGYYDGSSNLHVPIKYIGNYIIDGSIITSVKSTSSDSYVKLHEIKVKRNGYLSVIFTTKATGLLTDANVIIYRNGSSYGITHDNYSTYTKVIENLYFDEGDIVELYAKANSVVSVTDVKNFALCGSEGSVNYDYL